jgi:hypothetical protein
MAIETQTNFTVQATAPADDRNVVDDINARNNIEYKFAGLKTFVLSEGVTYVYGTDSVWRLDGGGGNGGGNGIYGGSGSIPGDVSVFLGTLSNAVNDRSNYLYYENRGFTEGDKNLLYNYAYRKGNGNDYDTMAFRTEQKLIPFGSSTLQGPYLEYNGESQRDPSIKGSFIIGVPNLDLTQKLIRIETNNYHTAIFPSDSNGETPFAFTKINNKSIFGFNISSYSPGDSYRYTVDGAAYRMSFDVFGPNFTWDFQTLLQDDGIPGIDWQTVMSLNNTSRLTNISSPVTLSVDSSSRDWDGVTTRTPTLLTPQQIVRDIEHRYSKIQMLSQGTSNTADEFGVLYLNTDGNSFTVNLFAGQEISDIKAYKSSQNTPEFPAGTIINIRFINTNPDNPGYINIYDNSESSTSKIKSDITDATFELNDFARLTINHGVEPIKHGEVITFRRIDEFVGRTINKWWEIVSINRERKIVTRNWEDGSDTTKWSFLPNCRYLTATSSSGIFQSFQSAIVQNPLISLDNPPNKWGLPISGVSTVGLGRDSKNPTGFKFRISVDGNRIVFVQGNFSIFIKDNYVRQTQSSPFTKKLYLRSIDKRTNIWYIGKIGYEGFLPQWETTWTNVNCFGTAENAGKDLSFEITNSVFSINRSGDIFLSFDCEAFSNPALQTNSQGMYLEVSVPPFSYTAATGSYTTGGGGGVIVGGS